jgi:integrase
VAIYKRGGVYWFSFVFNGKRVQESTKQANRKAAIDIESAHRTALAKGEVGIAPKKREKRIVGDLLTALEENYKQAGKWTSQNKSLLTRARSDFGSKSATALTAEDIEKYIARRRTEGARNSSINRISEVLRRAYKLAKLTPPDMEHLSEKDNVRTGFFSEAELALLVSHLPSNLQDFTKFAAACGMRKGEIAKLTWKMVEGDELRIPGSICKNRKDRVLPLTGEIAEIIERRRAALPREKNGTVQMCEYIFHRDGSPVAELRKSWASAAINAGLGIMVCKKCGGQGPEKYCKKCKIAKRYQGRLFHDLRRSAVRNMVQAGVSTQVAKKWSGHSSDSVFERYSIIITDDMREAQKQTEEYRKSQREKIVAIAK